MNRAEAAGAVAADGWTFLLDTFAATVEVGSMAEALDVAAHAIAACGDDAGHLRVDLRPGRVELLLAPARPDPSVAALARAITAALAAAGRTTGPRPGNGRTAAPQVGDGRTNGPGPGNGRTNGPQVGDGRTNGPGPGDGRTNGPQVGDSQATGPRPGTGRPVQQLEIAIDAIDIPAVVPFWRAVLGYVDDGEEALVDPAGQGPAFWFQQMDAPRPQRNRIHFDVSVAPEEAAVRIEAALAAGGHLVSDGAAPAFWVLADSEGNEICVCTWQGRD